jgi:transposase
MKKMYVVKLSNKDRQWLNGVVRRGRDSARKIVRARILLKADASREGWSDARIAEALEVGTATVERVRKRLVTQGLQAAVERRPQPPRPQKRRLDGAGEARLVALACSKPPQGHDRWTLDLLADLPRTNNDLEQLFGSTRHHERRCTGRKAASPSLVLRGSVRIVAGLGTRRRCFQGKDLAPGSLETWQTLRAGLERRRHTRTLRQRFRRNPEAYLRHLEALLLKRTLPP